MNPIRKIAKEITADYYSNKQKQEIKNLLSKQIPHNGFDFYKFL